MQKSKTLAVLAKHGRSLGSALRHRSNDLVTTLLDAAGVASIVAGVYQIYAPAGWIVSGIATVSISYRFGYDK